MKTISLKSLTNLALIFLGLALFLPANAQKNNAGVAKSKSMEVSSSIPFCDEAIPRENARLQKAANENCETRGTCILCLERNSKTPLYASMIVQPNDSKCQTVEPQQDQVAILSNGKSKKDDNPDFYVDIIQSPCTKSGASVQAYILADLSKPAANSNKGNKDYTYLWEVDGKKAGHERELSCACGSMASVIVTQQSTGQRIKKEMKLPACPKNNQD